MAKKKVAKKKKSNPSAAPLSAPQTSPQIKADLGGEVQPEYTIGSWSGIPQYRCNLCAFDCLKDEKKMLTHLMEVHNSEAALEKILGDVPEPAPLSASQTSPQIAPQERRDDLGGEDDVEIYEVEVEVTDEERIALEEMKDA